jgi:hypothetical protein
MRWLQAAPAALPDNQGEVYLREHNAANFITAVNDATTGRDSLSRVRSRIATCAARGSLLGEAM